MAPQSWSWRNSLNCLKLLYFSIRQW
jgi:hypothetical protein